MMKEVHVLEIGDCLQKFTKVPLSKEIHRENNLAEV